MERKIARRVILETPYAGDIEMNTAYARACMRDCLLRGEAPIASHLLYTQPNVLRDEIPEERAHGIDAGLSWGSAAEATVLYVDRGISRGMRYGKDRAIAERRGVEERWLYGYTECMSGTKFIVAVIGQNGSGKGTLTRVIEEKIAPLYPRGFGVITIRSGNIIMQRLELGGIPETRANAIKDVKITEKYLKPEFLSRKMKNLIIEARQKVVVWDGVRLFSDIAVLRELHSFMRHLSPDELTAQGISPDDWLRASRWGEDTRGRLMKKCFIYVATERKLRFERMKARKEKLGEESLAWETFLKEDRAYTERAIPQLARYADVVIENNGSEAEFGQKAAEFVQGQILPEIEIPKVFPA